MTLSKSKKFYKQMMKLFSDVISEIINGMNQKQPFAGALKNFLIFIRKYLCRNVFLVKFQV